MHGLPFGQGPSGKLWRHEVNPRYGVNRITPTGVAEDEGDAFPTKGFGWTRGMGTRTEARHDGQVSPPFVRFKGVGIATRVRSRLD